MKHKILSFLTAFAMVASILVAPFAKVNADNANEPAGGPNSDSTTIVVHKVLMNNTDYEKFGEPREHDGKEITNVTEHFGASAEYIDGVAFRIYEVSEAAKDGFVQGSTIDEKYRSDLSAQKYYKLIKNGEKDFFITANGGKFEATLGKGNYRIIEDKENSTYNTKNITGYKAVPFDLKLPAGKPDGTGNFSTTDKLHIYPKNTEKKVEFDKNFAQKNGLEAITDPQQLKDVGAVIGNYKKEKAKATADIGKELPYHAKAQLPKDTYFRSLDLADTFDRGIEFIKGSMVVTYNTDANQAEGSKQTLNLTDDYTINETTSGFTLNFTKAGLKKLNDAAKAKDIYVDFNYKGKVTKDAVVDDEMDNNITITYNHEPPTPSPETKPNDKGEIQITKTWNGKEKADKVKYVLLQGDKAVADVTLTSTETTGEKDLGNGIKFVITGEYSGKFTGLDNKKTYKVQEFVDGFTPKYTTSDQAGVLSIVNNTTPTSITPTPPKVVTGGKKFVKTDYDNAEDRLEGAQFKIYKKVEGNNKFLTLKSADTKKADKEAYDKAETAYIKAVEEKNAILKVEEKKRSNEQKQKLETLNKGENDQGSIAQLKKARDDAYTKVNLVWDWGAEADAYVFTSNEFGGFEVKGLAYNKAGEKYYVKETKAPAGYELPSNADNVAEFVVKQGSYKGETSDLDYKIKVKENEKEVEKTDGKGQQIKNIKVSIPKTGGIGSIIFVIAGLMIMGLAAYKMKANKEQA
ncbi:MAG: pilin N-terminal domain-containing protein [Anaerococcus vaginalis]|nr:pilin N-terminal domain-containing protein [Anaerococcus vaginalis]